MRDFLCYIFEKTYKEGEILDVILVFPVLPETLLKTGTFVVLLYTINLALKKQPKKLRALMASL